MQGDGKGGDVFLENHYAKLFQGRWANLYQSLKKPVNTIALIPPFYSNVPDQQEAVEVGGIVEHMETSGSLNEDPSVAFIPTVLPWCYTVDDGTHQDAPNRLVNKTIFDANGHVSRLNDYVYYLDGASAFAAFCLDVSPGEKVLDMCSSPGGKSIILASQLFRERSTLEGIRDVCSLSTSELVSALKTKLDSGVDECSTLLVCNEISSARFKRLVETIGRFIPQKHISGKHIQFVNYDATSPDKLRRFGKFDKILLDAPCSSERHLIRNGQPWSYKNVKENSKRQLQLLQTAVSLLKPGGVILYCTCALDPLENELVS